jgi:hypothetical protein
MIMSHYTEKDVFVNYLKTWRKQIEIEKQRNRNVEFLFLYGR